MTPRLPVLFGLTLAIAVGIQNQRAAAPTDPETDSQILKLLQEARALIERKNPPAAIEKCDRVIASFKNSYGNRKEKIYCARWPTESLGYLVMAAADKKSAKVLSSTWSDAYFMKAYALQDMGRLADAKSEVKLAIELSPFNSQYVSELGEIYQLEKDWPKAKRTFEEAEDHASLSPDELRVEELGRARRGLAYVMVELGQLEDAEKKYQQCLAANPNDTRSARELEYVRQLRAKAKSQ